MGMFCQTGAFFFLQIMVQCGSVMTVNSAGHNISWFCEILIQTSFSEKNGLANYVSLQVFYAISTGK